MARVERKHFEVRSARNAEFFRSGRPWVAVSISSSANVPTILNEENRGGLLRLVFEDTEGANSPTAFTPALARTILDFAGEMWDKVDTLLIHSEVGLSRSPPSLRP